MTEVDVTVTEADLIDFGRPLVEIGKAHEENTAILSNV